MKKFLSYGYLLAVHALVAMMLLHSDFVSRVREHLGLAVDQEQPFIQMTRATHAQMDASVPAGASIFLGDSLTQALATAAVAPNAVNFGISLQRSDQLLASMAEYRSLARAGRVFVVIGTNDLLLGKDSGLERRYRAIIGKIPKGIPVVMASPPPTRRAPAAKVARAGAAARTACTADPRCTFVDLFGAMEGQSGILLDDGVHLSPKGYSVMIAQLRAGAGS